MRTLASKNLEPEYPHMEAEQVLKLIRSAPQRYETLRAALCYRGDTLGVMKGMYSNLGIDIDEAQLVRAVRMHAW